MASALSISRLHAAQRVSTWVSTQPAPVKTDIVSDSEPDLLAMQMVEWMRPARGFALQRRETRFDAPALMSPIGDTGRFPRVTAISPTWRCASVTQARQFGFAPD